MAARPLEPHQAKAVEAFFLGDADLFQGFLSACCEQFPNDIAQGDKACAAADWPALRVTAHNLKSILLTLGYPDLHGQARALEQSCVASDAAQSPLLWASIRTQLQDISNTLRSGQ